MKKKQIKIGTSDFRGIIESNGYYVDKSLFIKEFIDNGYETILFPRPRRFGKTLNLSMLRYFFDVNEKNTQQLFTELKIWQEGYEYTEKQGKYPVIFLTFKDVKTDNWTNCYQYFQNIISKLYFNFSFLGEGKTLSEYEKTIFDNVLYKRANQVDLENSLINLSEFLYKYYQQNVVILIDEYDTPIHSAFQGDFYKEVVSFMRNFLSGAFKDNNFLYKGAITGILRVSRESIFSGLNNLGVYSILNYEFADKFGFTETEVKQLLTDFQLATEFDHVKSWYDGYQFGRTTDIYNPWSITNYVVKHEEGFKPHWVNTSSDDLIRNRISEREADAIRQDFLSLIKGETVEKTIEDCFVFQDFETKKELLFSLLLYSGYLTIEKCINLNRNLYAVKVPNYEVNILFKNIFLFWLNTQVKLQQELLSQTTKYLINNQIDKFETGFKQIIGDTFSYYDTNPNPEKIYQAYLLGLLAIVGDDYLIKSNRESGDGRYDILLIPHDKNRYGIVMELKQIPKQKKTEKKDVFKKRINDKIEEAQNQIEQNLYYKELIDNQITKIIKLPVVFVGKEPYILPLKIQNK